MDRHGGVVVYAGGDDLLAMLPVEGALACADALARTYRDAFPRGRQGTLSAAVVFAHVRQPLMSVLAEAHRLLDEEAKDRNGRSSLAVAVLKSSGLHSQWVSSWERTGPGGARMRATEALEALCGGLRGPGDEPGLSSSLLYRLRDTLGLLCDWPRWQPGAWAPLPHGVPLRSYIEAELRRTLPESEAGAESGAGPLAETITALLSASPNPGGVLSPDWVGVDALLLARFLSSPSEGDAR
ncbi:MAG: hypothetical protein D6729_19425 [Deltaproteobacteria bacterium]|nr:MAG: hypothetical protein D6729_19425 [Deltaproteobacteria bacterium]